MNLFMSLQHNKKGMANHQRQNLMVIWILNFLFYISLFPLNIRFFSSRMLKQLAKLTWRHCKQQEAGNLVRNSCTAVAFDRMFGICYHRSSNSFFLWTLCVSQYVYNKEVYSISQGFDRKLCHIFATCSVKQFRQDIRLVSEARNFII